MNSSNSNLKSPSPPKERRRTPMACTNCRSCKLKVRKPFSKVSYPCSHYPSVVHSSRSMVPFVRDVSKELFVITVPLIQVRPRTTILLLVIIKITSSTFIMSLAGVLFRQTKNPLILKTNLHPLSIKPGALPSPPKHYLPRTLPTPIRPCPSKSADAHPWLARTQAVVHANSRSVNLFF